MGSMQSESKTIYSEDTFFSNVEFAFKGKGVARLMSRVMHTGTIISLNDSTVSNIDFKKKKYSIKTFDEILKKKENNDNKNVNQDNADDENVNEELNEFFISKEPELVNGFEAYKITIQTKRKKIEGTSNTTEFGNKTSTTFEAQEKTILYSNYIWFSKTLKEPDLVIKIKNEISEFQNSWANMSIDLTEYGIDKDSIIVKMSTESEDGNFNFDLTSFQIYTANDMKLTVPEDFKKVRKI